MPSFVSAQGLPVRSCVSAIVGALLVAAVAADEPSKLQPPDLERYRRWGPLWARPGIEVSNVGYDTNILVSTVGQEVPDFTATVSPRLEGLVLFGRTAFLTFRERLEYTAYAENTDQNYLNNRFQTRITLPANRVGVFVEVELDNVQERPTDLQDIRTRRRERRLRPGLVFTPGSRTEIEFSGRINELTYRDPDDTGSEGRTVGDVLDRTETALIVDSAWRAAGRTTLLFEALLEEIDFRAPGVVAGIPIDRDGRAWSLLPGVRFGEGGPLEGVARIGWGQYTPREQELPTFSDWIGEVNLAYLLGWRTRMILTGQRLLNFSLLQGSPYYLDTTVGLRAVHYVTRVIGLELGTSRTRLTFPGSFAFVERIDEIRNREAGVRLRMFEGEAGARLEYSVRLTHYDRTSNVPGGDRTKTSLTMGVVAGF